MTLIKMNRLILESRSLETKTSMGQHAQMALRNMCSAIISTVNLITGLEMHINLR